MKNDCFITRKDHWADKDGPDILLSDWLAYQTIDPSIQADPEHAYGSLEEAQSHVIWTEWPGQGAGAEARFRLEGGNVIANRADAAIRQKLFVMAHVLNATVQGPKGQVFDSVGAPEGRKRHTPSDARSWWRFW